MTKVANMFRAVAAGALILAVSGPALAGEPYKSDQAKVTYNAKSGKYCFKATFTGSRMSKDVCRTREQWAAEGVEIPQKDETAIAAK